MTIYEPTRINPEYTLPIFDSDTAILSYTWRELIDIYVANYGHDPDPEKFREHIKEIIREVTDDVMETYKLCQDGILKEVERS